VDVIDAVDEAGGDLLSGEIGSSAELSGGCDLMRTPGARNMRSRPLPRATIVSNTALPPTSALPPKTASIATAPCATGDQVTCRFSSLK
jgi:hypothetical protein